MSPYERCGGGEHLETHGKSLYSCIRVSKRINVPDSFNVIYSFIQHPSDSHWFTAHSCVLALGGHGRHKHQKRTPCSYTAACWRKLSVSGVTEKCRLPERRKIPFEFACSSQKQFCDPEWVFPYIRTLMTSVVVRVMPHRLQAWWNSSLGLLFLLYHLSSSRGRRMPDRNSAAVVLVWPEHFKCDTLRAGSCGSVRRGESRWFNDLLGAEDGSCSPTFPTPAGSSLQSAAADWQLRAALMKSRFSFSQSTDWCSSLALLFLSGTISAWWIFSGGKTVQPPSQRGHLCWDSLRTTGEQTLSRCSPPQMRDLVPAVAEEGNYSVIIAFALIFLFAVNGTAFSFQSPTTRLMRARTQLCLRKPHRICLFQKPAVEIMAGGKRHIFKTYFSV